MQNKVKKERKKKKEKKNWAWKTALLLYLSRATILELSSLPQLQKGTQQAIQSMHKHPTGE